MNAYRFCFYVYKLKFCLILGAQLDFFSMKQISVKQAQKWLDKLKNQDLQAYKDITKFLRKYQKTEDEYDCFIKINHTLLNHFKLADELNTFMDDGNKMVVNKPQDQKIRDLMTFMKKSRPEIFTKIITIITQMSKSGLPSEENNAKLKIHIKQIIKHDDELSKVTQQALELTGQQLIARLDLDHLKLNRAPNQMVDEFDEDVSKQKNQRQVKKQVPKIKNVYQKEVVQQIKPQRAIPFTAIASIDDQKFLMKHLQKNLDPKTYNNLIKIMRLFYLNIITKNQIFQFITALDMEQQVQFLKQIIQTRESDRRRLSVFKPLNDLDFSNCDRPSPSYVLMPISYPNRCKGRDQMFKKLLNDVYVSVPHGSEQNFNVRFKNSNEVNLLKSEDQRYEFDLYMMRLNKSFIMLQKILQHQDNSLTDQKLGSLVDKIISMGIIQLIYKNCNKEQKQQLQWHLKNNQYQTLDILKDRIQFQIKQMEQIKSIHAIRTWYQVASKNFSKALDLKGFQFKKNQKQKMKSTYFITQLHQRANNLQNGGQAKLNLLIPFQDRKDFFAILNSFQASSRTEKCLNRELPQVKTYDLHDQQKRKYFPVMIFAFQNKGICQKVYSLIHFYIDTYTMGDSQKIRCKLFLQNFLIQYLQWEPPLKRFLNQNYDQQKLYLQINNSLQEHIDLTEWITETIEQRINVGDAQQQLPNLSTFNDQMSPYGYLPQKSSKNKVFYGSQQLYALVRFIYTLYERIIKMEQVAEYQQKIILFELLFYACIKAKQGVKFQQNLNLIFGKHAYLFSTIYKLCDNLIRSLSAVSTCLMTAQSMKLSKLQSQQIYLLMLNKFCLSNQLSNNKLIRFTYESQSNVIYLNLLQSFYKIQDNPKDLFKKRIQINKGIQIYTIDSWYDLNQKKKRKPNEAIVKNNQQYLFQGSTIKMVNHKQKQDLISFIGKCGTFAKNLKKQMKRVSKVNNILY